MKYIHKEVRFIDKEISEGNPLGDAIIQTRYDFDLLVDLLGQRPSCMVNAFTRILYPDHKGIAVFGCMAVFVFDEGDKLTAEKIIELTKEIKPEIDSIFYEKCNPDFNLPVYETEKINEQMVLPHLRKLVLSGFRSN
ncbi:MAG: hypothetical protein WC756_06725 [Taibaiella sp.]|jgi:hypothetical protein